MALIGEFDVSSKERLRAALSRLESAGDVVLDLSEVRYLDSTAIGEFIRLHKARKARGFPRETVVIPNASLRRIFDILRLAEVFDFADSLPDAVGHNHGLLDLDFIADGEVAPYNGDASSS